MASLLAFVSKLGSLREGLVLSFQQEAEVLLMKLRLLVGEEVGVSCFCWVLWILEGVGVGAILHHFFYSCVVFFHCFDLFKIIERFEISIVVCF